MATYRGQGSDSFIIGSAPPNVSWTLVRGDTAAFRVYVTDAERTPLTISEWTIKMDIKRPSDNNNLVFTLNPAQTVDDDNGEFTVSITSSESEQLETSDIFDIQLSTAQDDIVWTVAQGRLIVLEDVTD